MARKPLKQVPKKQLDAFVKDCWKNKEAVILYYIVEALAEKGYHI